MEEDTSGNITNFIIETVLNNNSYLGNIRHWDNLTAAIDGTTLWIKGFTAQEIAGVEVQSIPYKKVYYKKNNLLFPKDSLLPEKKLKSILLWSPVASVLPVSLPLLNHNYFGINQKINIALIPVITEQPVAALYLPVSKAAQYIYNAAQIRLTGLTCIGVNNNILIIGTPLLPVDGQSHWMDNDMLFPTGYDLEFPQLRPYVKNSINTPDYLILWDTDGGYILLPKNDIKLLSISSFRLTYSLT